MLFVALVHVASAQRQQSIYKSNGTSLKCIVDANDNSTCIYTDINSPFDLYKNLPDANNPQAGAIKKLKFYKCYMDNLYAQLFSLFPNVTEVQASNQYLTRLERGDIGKTNTLLSLNVSYNRIHRLGGEVTAGANWLENFDISHNILERLMPDAFKYNVNLKYINMSHNLIVSLDRQFFEAVRSAHILKLDNNKITDITGNFEHFVSAFQELHLQNNFIATIDPSLLRQPPYLDLSLNKVTELNLAAARTIELKVVGNQLQKLAIGRKLQKLDASENRLYLFRIDCEASSNNLTHLNLSYIKYSLTDEKLLIDFRKFDKLKVLDLSYNNLMSFDITDLAYGVSRTIQTLNFQNAHVKKLKNWDKIKFLLPNLREINLFDNIFECNELEQMIPQLQQLKVTLPGYESDNNETFVSRSCTRFPRDSDSPSKSLIKPDHAVLIWCFVAVFLIGFTVTGIVFINRKLSVFEKLYDALKVNPYRPRGSKLLDEEKANDTENSF
jgi:Leucine-rich repeat (LRR) protein